MARFTGTWVNRIDKKGRVSVPPSFRSILEIRVPAPPSPDGQPGGTAAIPARFSVRPSADGAAIDGLTEDYLDDVQRRVDALPMNSPERIALEMREFSLTMAIQADPEGRVVIPRPMLDDAGIDEEVAFAGFGSRFQLWEPARLERVRREILAANQTLTIPAVARGGAA